MQGRLDRFHGPQDNISFFGKLRLVDVLIEEAGLDHLANHSSILAGHMMDSKLSSLSKLNVSHLYSPYFHAMVHYVQNLVPHLIGDRGWMLWWEETG